MGLLTVLAVLAVSACGAGADDRYLAGEGAVAESGTADEVGEVGEVGEVMVTSGDAVVTRPPVCTGDIPEDITACAAAPQNVGTLPLSPTRKLAVTVPREVAQGGWRLRVDGKVLYGRGSQPLTDQYGAFTLPPEVVPKNREMTLDVVGLLSRQNPRAVWRFFLSTGPTSPAR